MKKSIKVLIISSAIVIPIGIGAGSYAAWSGNNVSSSATAEGSTGLINTVGDLHVTPRDGTYTLDENSNIRMNKLYPVDHSGDGLKYWTFELESDTTGDPYILYSIDGSIKDGNGNELSSESARLFWTDSPIDDASGAISGTAFGNSDKKSNIVISDRSQTNTVYVYMQAYSVAAMNADVSLTFQAELFTGLSSGQFAKVGTATDEFRISATVSANSFDAGNMPAFGVKSGKYSFLIVPGANPIKNPEQGTVGDGRWSMVRIYKGVGEEDPWSNIVPWYQANFEDQDIGIPVGTDYKISLAMKNGTMAVTVGDKIGVFHKENFTRWESVDPSDPDAEWVPADTDPNVLSELFDPTAAKTVGVASKYVVAEFKNMVFTDKAFDYALPKNSTQAFDNGAVTANQGFSVSAKVASNGWFHSQGGFSIAAGGHTYVVSAAIWDGLWHNYRIYRTDGKSVNFDTKLQVSNVDKFNGYEMSLTYKDGKFIQTIGGQTAELTYEMLRDGGENTVFYVGELADFRDLFDPALPKTVGVGSSYYEGGNYRPAVFTDVKFSII